MDFENPFADDDSAITNEPVNSIFAIRGNLDGEDEQDFVEKEQFIGLLIGEEEFLLPISEVAEINMLSPITFVPNGPQYVDGVINLRGNILPAINLRKMMNLPKGKATPSSRLVVVNIENVQISLLVDGITYVVALLPNEVENQNLPGKGTGAEFIARIGKYGKKVLGILDLGKIFTTAGGTRLNDEGDEEVA